MSLTPIYTSRLTLHPQGPEEMRAQIAAMTPEARAHVSPAWLAKLEAATQPDPWTFGFKVVSRTSGLPIGSAGFKGPPDAEGVVEIAYGVAPEHEGKGFATEAAQALVTYASSSGLVRVVRAHTVAKDNASARVLTKCGFTSRGEATDPEDGVVWRWEMRVGELGS
jgi:RimJ/RimL family protein N-acetyltransferase